MLASNQTFVSGMISEDVAVTVTESARAAEGPGGRDLFGRFVNLYQSNEFLIAELASVKKKVVSAQAYLESTGSNPSLAKAQLNHLKVRRSAILTMLRANRLQAQDLLIKTGKSTRCNDA